MNETQLFNEEAEACILDIEMNYPQLYHLIEAIPFKNKKSKTSVFSKDLQDYINSVKEQLQMFQTKFLINENEQKHLKKHLEVLCFQTDKWIEDVEFYEEELDFFNNLISNRINNTTITDLNHKEIYRNIDSLLYELSEDILIQIKRHRRRLAQLISGQYIKADLEENKRHNSLFEKMNTIDHGIKIFKKTLFKYLKDYPFKFEFDTVIEEL
jgi:hypothetical protein